MFWLYQLQSGAITYEMNQFLQGFAYFFFKWKLPKLGEVGNGFHCQLQAAKVLLTTRNEGPLSGITYVRGFHFRRNG